MMGVFELLLAGFILGLTHAVPPGPITLEIIRRGVSEGARAALLADVGAVVADAVFFVLVAAGLGGAVGIPGARIALWLGGCALLAFLGLRGVYGLVRNKAPLGSGRQGGGPPLAAGFLVCITSPFALAWWTGVFAGSVSFRPTGGFSAMAAIFSGIALACLGWYALLGLASSAGRRAFRPSWMSGLALVCSLMMLVFAVVLFFRGYPAYF